MGCDTGHANDVPVGAGGTVHIVGANIGLNQPLATGTPIELAFDRLLDPISVTRQTFVLQDLEGDYVEPSPSYDPVARIVRLCFTDTAAPLSPDQTYKLTILSPTSPTDTSGLRAIDGANLDPSVNPVIEFPVVAAPAGGYVGSDACAGATPVDFCTQVFPIFTSKCGGTGCHAGTEAAAGLQMTTTSGILATAIGRVAQGSNTGDQSQAVPPSIVFGVDMPIIGTGDPGNSWILYKLLLAEPPACSSTPGAAPCDAGAPGVVDNRYPTVTPEWQLLSDTERATLANYIPGREMPYPVDPSAPLTSATTPLTGDELDTVSAWIQQGAGVPQAGCP